MYKSSRRIVQFCGLGTTVACALVLPSQANGTVIYSNLSNTSSGSTDAATGTQYLTESFTTGSTVYTQLSATLDLEESVVGTSLLSLYSDSASSNSSSGGLQPGTLLAAFTSPTSYPSSSISTATYNLSTSLLAANTTYWLVLSAPTGEFDWEFTSDNITNSNGLSPDAGATWYTDDTFPYQVSVSGSTLVPEPVGLVGLSLTGLLLSRRRPHPQS